MWPFVFRGGVWGATDGALHAFLRYVNIVNENEPGADVLKRLEDRYVYYSVHYKLPRHEMQVHFADLEYLEKDQKLQRRIAEEKVRLAEEDVQEKQAKETLRRKRARLRLIALDRLETLMASPDEAIAMRASIELSKYNSSYEARVAEKDAEAAFVESVVDEPYPDV